MSKPEEAAPQQEEEGEDGDDVLFDYEADLLSDLFHSDSLTVMARGLGLYRILTKLFTVYIESRCFVLVLNATAEEQNYFVSELSGRVSADPIRLVSSEQPQAERTKLYMSNRVHLLFISSQIAIVDLLQGALPVSRLQGVIVLNANQTREDLSQEAFALRIIKTRRHQEVEIDDVFVKAFSDRAYSFLKSFCSLEILMKSLFIDTLCLSPRFHSSVNAFYESEAAIDVVRHSVPLTDAMSNCHVLLIDLLATLIRELKQSCPTLNAEHAHIESILTRAFDKCVKRFVEPKWNEISWKVKQLIESIKSVRYIVESLFDCDAISFYLLLMRMIFNTGSENAATAQIVKDLASSSAEKLRVDALLRVKIDGHSVKIDEQPKWSTLIEILRELTKANIEQKPVVIVQSERIADQIRNILEIGSEMFLKTRFIKNSLEFTDLFDDGIDVSINEDAAGGNGAERIDYDGIVIYSIDESADVDFLKLLDKFRPSTFIFYHQNLAILRSIEVYRAELGRDVSVHILSYDDSMEEQNYLSQLKMENESFLFLIEEKSRIVVNKAMLVEECRSDVQNATSSVEEDDQQIATMRKATNKSWESSIPPQIIVDMREFRSQLPSMLYKRHFNILPVQLETADYILSPQIAVERKSVNDLIGSLNSGRLYTQAEQLCRVFEKPILLVEFQANEKFAFDTPAAAGDRIVSTARQKLITLTLHFPRLSIIWSPTLADTAIIFDELKKEQPQPTLENCNTVSIEEKEMTEKYNPTLKTMLTKLPGVTTRSCYHLLNSCENLRLLSSKQSSDFNEILSTSSARNATIGDDLWSFFNQRLKDKTNENDALLKTKSLAGVKRKVV